MQFQQDWPEDNNYSSFNFLAENLEIFRSTELYGGPLEGSTIFLHQLTDLKYAIFSRRGHKTKKLPNSQLFIWTVFKHGLLEGSTLLLQYSAITRTPLVSSPLGELEYAISPG